MPDKVLCFKLNGYALGVEPDQVEKILINKKPERGTFTLETGVEVKRLHEYIPLPEGQGTISENILFVKDQKNFFGFTVDKVQGYLRLHGGERIKPKGGRSPVKYFVRQGEYLIPVLDLQYITNEESPVPQEIIDDIVQSARIPEAAEAGEGDSDVFEDVREDEIFRTIEEEINKRQATSYVDDVIESEKKGMILPLVINVVIVAIFAAGILFYLTVTKERVGVQTLGGVISGVEEEVIREIRRRSEEEIEQQKKKLADTRSKLASLMEERDFFLKNQDKILAEREAALNEDFQKKLEEARNRLLASGTADFNSAFAEEQERLEREYRQSLADANSEIEQVKSEYEREMAAQETALRREVSDYSQRIDDIEKQLLEEQAKLKEAELQVASALSQQQEYFAFRKTLSSIYGSAVSSFAKEEYGEGISELRTMFPVIEAARESGVAGDVELQVEEELVNNIINMAQNQQEGVTLQRMAESSFNQARQLEQEGKLNESLTLYHTAYTITSNRNMRNQALNRANTVMDQIYQNLLGDAAAQKEGSADSLFARAMTQKEKEQYEMALNTLEELVSEYPETSKIPESFDEIMSLNRLILMEEEQARMEDLNQQAASIMNTAEQAYENGYLTESLDRYGEVVSDYYGSDYVEEALGEIKRITEVMRSVQATPKVVFGGTDARTGVIIQSPAENIFLFNLGMQDGLDEGDVMGIFRKQEETFIYIGSLKVFAVYPTVSKGKVIYYEQPFKIGDIVSPS
jgi:hypothetical protein